MRRLALYGTIAVALVTVVKLLHGLSHVGHEVPLTAWQMVYVDTVIFLASIVAAVLLWTRFRRTGRGSWWFRWWDLSSSGFLTIS